MMAGSCPFGGDRGQKLPECPSVVSFSLVRMMADYSKSSKKAVKILFNDQPTSLDEQPIKAIRARGISLITLAISYI
jgi:hypothetical protein